MNTNGKAGLYIEIKVWKHVGESAAVRYSCLHDVALNRYMVQSADFFRLPYQLRQNHDFDKQFVELFIENPPAARKDWFDSLEDAVASHDREFA